MKSTKLLQLADRTPAVKEELVETFLMDVMNQLDGLDPEDDGDELIEMMSSALEVDDESDSTLSQLFSYLLGCPLKEWLEDFTMSND